MKELIKQALDSGILLSPRILRHERLRELIQAARESGEFYLDITQSKLEIIKPKKPESVKASEIIDFYQQLYRELALILSKKVQAVSINKISGECWIIGMVREKTENGFLLEDLTGQIEVISRVLPEEDDVVAVRGYGREGRFFAKEILWPDIPLDHKPSKAGIKAVFKPDEIILGERKIKPEAPLLVKINGFRILVIESQDPVRVLKRRHFFERGSSPDSFYLLKEIPDILYVPEERQGFELYKGVLILHGKWKCDLATLTPTPLEL
ncbi:MAG: hypothetical protein DRP12_01045 [Candidatus Aenigmatarchaeota archaeon]|nr:MAG: hypothetical protein DRP12_01045 [Candidatus Aenigmarchaeota archaeon]